MSTCQHIWRDTGKSGTFGGTRMYMLQCRHCGAVKNSLDRPNPMHGFQEVMDLVDGLTRRAKG